MRALAGRKILFVITKSNWGGAQAYVYALATAYKEAGADVVVALGGAGGRGAEMGLLAKKLSDAHVRVIPVGSFMRNMSMSDFGALRELFHIIKSERPDIIHLNSSKAAGLGALAGRFAGVKKIIYTAHGWVHRENRGVTQKALIWLASWVTILLAHHVIAVSKSEYDASPVFFSKKKISVVYNGIKPYLALPKDVVRAKVTSDAPGASEFPFWYLTIAELHPNKGLETLIEAFATLKASTALIVIGEGESRRKLEELIERLKLRSRVFLIGFKENARELLSGADVFVLPSRKEGLPFTILEAAIARVPVVATTVGAISEVVENEASGLLVTPNSKPELVRALLRMYDDHDMRSRMAERLRARVIRDFSEEEMIKRTAQVYLAA